MGAKQKHSTIPITATSVCEESVGHVDDQAEDGEIAVVSASMPVELFSVRESILLCNSHQFQKSSKLM
jgi:hypothetical protein